jgi:hypothetical protein
MTPYRDRVDGTRDRVTYKTLVTRSCYRLIRCAVGILPSHHRDDTVKACARVDGQLTRDVTTIPSSTLLFIPGASVLKSGASLLCCVVS